MARRFDRPTEGNLRTPPQVVRYHDKFLTALETGLTDIETSQTDLAAVVADLAAAVADIAAAQATAEAAAADAAAAQATADDTKDADALTASFTIPGEILTATDAGSDVTITILNHARQYGDGRQTINIQGDTMTGLNYSTAYYVYYNDPSFGDLTPTYFATTSAKVAAPSGSGSRHFCGKIITPAALGADTGGGIVYPGGGPTIGPTDIL